MTIRVPGWAWGLLAGLLAAAGVVLAVLVYRRPRGAPGGLPDPFETTPELYMETTRQELERAERVDAEARERQAEVAEILSNPDPDARTTDLAELLNRWNP